MDREQLRSCQNVLHVITDFWLQQRFSHADLTGMAFMGGADMVQFRHKDADVRALLHEARRARMVAHDVRESMGHRPHAFIVNDRIDVALAVQADGVHLGQSDFPARDARRMLGPKRIVGVTATTREQCLQAERDGADYIGFGPVFPTRSKNNPAEVKGLDDLSRAVESVSIPVFAIAGITLDRVPSVFRTGARGVAVMTAITMDDDPESATRSFRQVIDS